MSEEPEVVLDIPRELIRPFVGQPREFFDPEKLQKLADGLKLVGQRVPAKVKRIEPNNGHEFELIDGQRRWIATGIAGIPVLRAVVAKVKDEDDQFVTSVVANLAGEPNSVIETAKAVQRIHKMGRTLAETAIIFSNSVTWVSQRLNLLKLDPAVIEMFHPSIPEDKRLAITTAQLLVPVPAPLQVELARTIRTTGMSAKQAKHLIAKTVKSDGLKRGSKFKPYKVFNKLSGSMMRMGVELKIASDTDTSTLRQILKGADLQRKMAMLEQMEENAKYIRTLEQRIRTIVMEGP